MGQDELPLDSNNSQVIRNITQVLYDIENIRKIGVEFMHNVNEKMDICVDNNAPSTIVTVQDYFVNYIALTKRGCKIRFVTEITEDNLSYCKEIMKIEIVVG